MPHIPHSGPHIPGSWITAHGPDPRAILYSVGGAGDDGPPAAEIEVPPIADALSLGTRTRLEALVETNKENRHP